MKKFLISFFYITIILLFLINVKALAMEQIVSIDLNTGEVSPFNIDENIIFEIPSYTSNNSIMPLDIIGTTDDRYMIENTSYSPFSCTCRVDACNPYDNANSPATAVMIGDNLALTAAHVVYKTDLGGAFHDVTVSPGYIGGDKPFGSATAITAIIPNGWLDNNGTTDPSKIAESENFDWAILVLDSAIGNNSGWLTPKCYEGASYINLSNSSASIIGYPSYVRRFNRYNNFLYQYMASGRIITAFSKRIEYDIDTSPGQSGSPIINSNNELVGVHNGKKDYKDSNDKVIDTVNRGIRIYPDMYTTIQNALNEY